jgi:hypothetical protein
LNPPFLFLTYFSHHQLILQTMTGNFAETLKKNLLNASHYPENLGRHKANRAYNQSVVEYLVNHNVQPLQTLLVGESQIKPGAMFWVEMTITFQGAGKAWEQLNYHDKVPSYFSFKINFEEFDDVIVEGQLNAEKCTLAWLEWASASLG